MVIRQMSGGLCAPGGSGCRQNDADEEQFAHVRYPFLINFPLPDQTGGEIYNGALGCVLPFGDKGLVTNVER
jgi:hypothetical protein